MVGYWRCASVKPDFLLSTTSFTSSVLSSSLSDLKFTYLLYLASAQPASMSRESRNYSAADAEKSVRAPSARCVIIEEDVSRPMPD